MNSISKIKIPLLLLFISFATAAFTQNPVIKFYPEIKKQEIVSIGGNYCQANYTNDAWDKVGEVTLEEFRPSHVRVALPLQFRDLKYSEYKGEKILDQPVIVSLLESMKRMKEEYGVSNFTVSVWRVPDELVQNPEDRNKRRIKYDKYDEVIDMIEVFLVEAQEEYGVETDYFSFNESDGGYNTIFSPEETIRFIKLAAESFRKSGLKTNFLWGDTHQTKGTVEFSTMIAGDSTIWKYLGPLSFHSWWSENIPDYEFERIAALAKSFGKPVWCSELGFDAMAHRTKGMNKTWDYAFRFAKIKHRMMKYAEVEVSMYWTWQNNYSIMSADTETKYPSYYVTRHYTDFLNAGTQVIHSLSTDPDILPICGYNKEDQLVMQIINLKKEPVNIEINNFVGSNAKMVTTTQNEMWSEKNFSPEIWKGNTKIKLEAESVNTIIF